MEYEQDVFLGKILKTPCWHQLFVQWKDQKHRVYLNRDKLRKILILKYALQTNATLAAGAKQWQDAQLELERIEDLKRQGTRVYFGECICSPRF